MRQQYAIHCQFTFGKDYIEVRSWDTNIFEYRLISDNNNRVAVTLQAYKLSYGLRESYRANIKHNPFIFHSIYLQNKHFSNEK